MFGEPSWGKNEIENRKGWTKFVCMHGVTGYVIMINVDGVQPPELSITVTIGVLVIQFPPAYLLWFCPFVVLSKESSAIQLPAEGTRKRTKKSIAYIITKKKGKAVSNIYIYIIQYSSIHNKLFTRNHMIEHHLTVPLFINKSWLYFASISFSSLYVKKKALILI